MFPPNILSWSKKFGIPPEILMERLDAPYPWDLFAALVVPADVIIEHIFIGLNNKAYHYVPWNDKPVTTLQLVQHYRPKYSLLYYLSNPDGKYMPYTRGGDE